MTDLTILCEVMELPKATCAHCRRLPEPVPRHLGHPFTAAYAGSCVDCADRFEPGDLIRADGEGGYVGPCCGEGS